ncbi:hypothetical protein [Mesobacterium pallidum]|uniref:hypothetical protein n=1 Tax=Mesobacterium pallidum TaxID=2872037 RepID=UPI001EE23585|nr:hypothetical protein [Mesobacterium pallidum]
MLRFGLQASNSVRIDAALIARFMVFRPDAERSLPDAKLRLLRALVSKRGQLVETRKRLLAQIKAHEKLSTADWFADMDTELKDILDRQIQQLEVQIEQAHMPQQSSSAFNGPSASHRATVMRDRC